MPTSIAITIARHLGADAAETEHVLEALVQDIRHDVARDGYAVVPGLGTFRFFDGTIVFEPDHALALAVNHRYAGLEPLLVSGTDIRYSPAPAPHQEPAVEAAPTFVTGAAGSGIFTSHRGLGGSTPETDVEEPGALEEEEPPTATSAPFRPEPETELPADEAPDLEEDDDAAPPPEYTEIVPTGFDPRTHEILPHEQEASTAPVEQEPPSSPSQSYEAWVEEETPDLMAGMPPYVPSIPALDGGDEDHPAGEEEFEEEEFEEVATDADYEPDDVEIGRHEEPVEDAGYQEPVTPLPEFSASPFFEPWPEDLPDLSADPVAGIYAEPEEEPLPSAGPDSGELPEIEPGHPYDRPEEIQEAIGEPENTFEPEGAREDDYSEMGAVAYEDPDGDTSGALPPIVVESSPEPEPVAAVYESTRPEHTEEEPERKRSITPWLVAAVAVLGVAMALVFLTSDPDVEPPPAQVVQNDPPPVLPSDTSAAAADTAGALATLAEPATTEAETPAAQPAGEVSPMRRPGGIDVEAGGLTLVVASTPSRTSAEAVADRFRQQGFTTAIFYGAYGGVTRYRVGVGQFSDQQTAETQLRNLPGGFPDDAWPMPIRSEMEVYQ